LKAKLDDIKASN